MPDSSSAAAHSNADVSGVTAPPPPRRRVAVIASVVVGALVISSMIWGGTAAAEAVAAERRLEAQRVGALGQLLDARSAAGELLATTAGVIATADEAASPVPDAHEALLDAHRDLVTELARLLDRETADSVIVAQSRLLDNDVRQLITRLDTHTRAVVDHARGVRVAAPLASAASLAALDAATTELAVEPQGLPSSYSGRAALVADVLTTAAAVTASHAAAKAEQERLEAERAAAAAAEAARRTAVPVRGTNTVYLLCGYDDYGEPFFCPYEIPFGPS